MKQSFKVLKNNMEVKKAQSFEAPEKCMKSSRNYIFDDGIDF